MKSNFPKRASRIEWLEQRIAPASFLVTSNADSGPGSLRKAILDANASANLGGPDLITFNIAVGQSVIKPLTPLPAISEAVLINGYSQPGSSPNDLVGASNARILVEIDGALTSGNGLVLGGTGGSTVRGLAIHGFTVDANLNASGLRLLSNDNHVEGNSLFGNAEAGVTIGNDGGTQGLYTGNVIGGTVPAQRNILSGNANGISLTVEAGDTSILGNLIGTTQNGLDPLPNNIGIHVFGSTNIKIGDGSAAGRNVISGNITKGIVINSGVLHPVISGNYIGTNVSGTADLANGEAGIFLLANATGAVIERNVISGNGGPGIDLNFLDFTPLPLATVAIRGNVIGANAAFTEAVPNASAGIRITGAGGGALIGGANAGDGNRIAYNGGAGIEDASGARVNVFQANTIFGNEQLDINIVGGVENVFGVTRNDLATSFGITSAPIFSAFENTGNGVRLDGTYAGLPNTTYRLEFFAAAPDQLDISAHGGGAVYLGFQEIVTDSAGLATFSYQDSSALPADTIFNSTATRLGAGGTSEFGQAIGPSKTFTWTGAMGTDWFEEENWSPRGVPGPLDAVDLSGGAHPIDLSQIVSVRSFQHLGNDLTGSGHLFVLDQWTWSGGKHDGVFFTLVDEASAQVGGTASLSWKNATLENRGSIVVNGNVDFDSSTLRNETGSSRLFLFASITNTDPLLAPSTAINFGTIEAKGNGLHGLRNIPLENHGDVLASHGIFSVDSIRNVEGFVVLQGGNISTLNGLVLDGGTLLGAGTIYSEVTNQSGTVRPTGILTVAGNFTQLSDGSLKTDILGPTAGSGYGVLAVTGRATINGNLEYSVDPFFPLGAGAHFEILTSNALVGTFAKVSGPANLSLSYDAKNVALDVFGFLVTTTDDSGPGSLRQAILDANARPGLDIISFAIPGGDVHTITPLSLLPAITDPVTINGYSQPGAFANDLDLGSDAVLLIELSGGAFGGPNVGLEIDASDCLISGLIINRWDGPGIRIVDADNTTIVGNWIGPDSGGGFISGNPQTGLDVRASDGTKIGAANPADRNVISGNGGYGIVVAVDNDETFGTLIYNNYIGVTPDGANPLGNGLVGIFLAGAEQSEIGGSGFLQGNVISANSGPGILLEGGRNNHIRGNLIGTDAAGFAAFGNGGYGIDDAGSTDLTIGDATSTPGTNGGNVIAANGDYAIHLGPNSNRARIYGNLIGLDTRGAALGNGGGVFVDSVAEVEVGNLHDFANVIAFNSADGIRVEDISSTPAFVLIRGNSIFANSGLGINLVAFNDGPDGVTPNDFNDFDDGPNGLINTPIITSVGSSAHPIVEGSYQGESGARITIDFFSTSGSGAGQGQIYVGSTTIDTDDFGNAQFSIALDAPIAAGSFLTATATFSGAPGFQNSSEFSPAFAIVRTFRWDGDAGPDTNWFNPINWDLDNDYPHEGDTAILDSDSVITLDDLDVTVGSFFLSAGTLTGNANLTIKTEFEWSGGAMSGTGATTLDFDAFGGLGGAFTKVLVDRTLLNRGDLVWQDGGNLFLDDSLLRNEGLFSIFNDASVTRSNGPRIENTGTFSKSDGSGATTISAGILFTNFGQLEVHAGTLAVGDLYSQSSGSTILYDADLSAISAVNINGGVLAGSGTISASVINRGVVQPGLFASGPNLTITGSYTQTANAELEIAFTSPTDFTSLTILNSASFAGKLTVDYFPVEPPAADSLFEVIHVGNVTSQFDTTNFAFPFQLKYLANGVNLAVPGLGASQTVDAKHPLTFLDGNDEEVRITLQGAGQVSVFLVNGATSHADIASLLLSGTDLSSKLTVLMAKKSALGTSVLQLTTSESNQHVGSITLGDRVTLGSGSDDSTPDLRVTGKLNALVLDDIQPHTLIRLGEGLPYKSQDGKSPDSHNNRPSLTIGDILGPGVEINILNNGISGESPGSLGGGGFGNVLIHSWQFAGFLRTTQSIGNFTVQTGDFYGVLKVDEFGQGELTQADVGAMTIQDGSWGSSGTEIEGTVKSFNAEAFLAGASIEAKSIGSIKMTEGAFEGTLILTDEDVNSPALATFTVDTNFTGSVISKQSIKKLKIKGDFTGSLEAPSIGSITAFSFLGTNGQTQIKATQGALGLLTSTAGIVRDYDLITPLGFSGITVKLAKLTENTVGIQNVHVSAASIGNLTVSLAAAKNAPGVNLTGILDSTFSTTATGTTKGSIGTLGNIAVALTGGAGGNGAGIFNSIFDSRVGDAGEAGASTVNALGKISVKVKGFGGSSIGLDTVRFEGDSIGATKVSVTKGGGATSARALSNTQFFAKGAIGALTFDGDVTADQVTALTVAAGGKVGAVSVKAKSPLLGNLVASTILAGQSAQTGSPKQQLANASLGAITLTGALRGTTLASGASIGAVKVGATMEDTLILAGARLGTDRTLGGGNDSFSGAATIAAIIAKGAVTHSSIIAGINPGNGIYGDSDDAPAPGGAGSIGPITLGANPSPLPGATDFIHQFVIQAAAIKGLKTTTGKITDFTHPQYLENANPGEDSGDILLRLR